MNVLLVEDSSSDARLIQELLHEASTDHLVLDHTGSLRQALASLGEKHFDAVLLDLGLPDSQGLATLEKVLEAAPEVAVVVDTGLADETLATEAMRRGAQDYVVKGCYSGELLNRTLRYAAERKQFERRLQNTQKLEVVGQLAGGIAHDFNNLLNLILGYSDLLAEELGEDHPGTRRLEQIRIAGQRAADLTRQLLAFGRRQALNPEVLDPNEELRRIEHLLKPLVGEAIELVLELDGGVGRVRIDPSQLHLALLNLTVNARDAMPKGGRLSLSTSTLELDEAACRRVPGARPGRYVQLAVADTGHGMDEATLARAFEPFFTTKEPDKGTGLGLATVYGIVSQSGGAVTAESTPNVGTRFRMLLPEVLLLRERPAPPLADAAPPGSERIFVVEDTAALRALIVEILTKAGYAVCAAEGAEDARRRFDDAAGAFDCLVTDVVMPGASGPELAADLKRRYPALKVLFISGYADDAVRQQGAPITAARLLAKPFSRCALLEAVREALNGDDSMCAKIPPRKK